MVEVELQYDASKSVSHRDADGIVATSATATLYAPNGSTVEAPTVTLPTLSTTATAASTTTILTLVSVTGIVRGDHLRITTAGIDYVVEALNVNGTAKTVTLTAALPVTPSNGDVVKSLKMTATVAAVGSAAIGDGYRLAWVYTDGTNPRQVGYAVSVVRWPWVQPCSAADVREIVAEIGGGNRAETWCADVALRVDDMIRGKVMQTGRRPSLYLSSALFSNVARSGIRYELAKRGICLGGQVYEAQRELRFAFDDELATVITGLQTYDSDADGAIAGAESKPILFTIQASR